MGTNEETKSDGETKNVTYQEFVALIIDWHKNGIGTLKHMKTMPAGSELLIGDIDKVELTGDFHKGFILGLSLALAELDKLPFTYEPPVPHAMDADSEHEH